jgi:hypothetical protein
MKLMRYEVVDIDDIIDYTMLNHDGTVDDDDDGDKGNTADGDGLLAYMAGHSPSAGDIRKVMATKTKIPSKVKSGTGTHCKVNASKSTSSTFQVNETTYYLYSPLKVMVISTQIIATFGVCYLHLLLCNLQVILLVGIKILKELLKQFISFLFGQEKGNDVNSILLG